MSQGKMKFVRGTFGRLSLVAMLALLAVSIPWIIRLRPQAAAWPTPGAPPTGQPLVMEIPPGAPTPAAPALATTSRPGAAHIQFWSGGGIDNDLLYPLIEKFQTEHPEIQIDVLDYWEHEAQDPDCFASAPMIQSVYAYDLQPLLITTRR
jgi:hypothetical protein